MPAGYAQGYSDYYNRKQQNTSEEPDSDITKMSDEDKKKFAIRKRLQKMKMKKEK